MINVFNCLLMDVLRKAFSIGKGGSGCTRPIFLVNERSYLNKGKLVQYATVVARHFCCAD
jgi:hypothetical protein